MTPPAAPTSAAAAPAPAAPAAAAPGGGAAAAPALVLAQAAGPAATGPAGAAPPPPATAAPQAGRVELPPPPPGQPAEVQVVPGMRLVLPDAAFLPPQAKYLVQGDDLVIETATGGVLTLDGFFAAAGATISVAGRPPVGNAFLFESAVVDAAGQTVIPTAPPSGPQPATSGNASFSPYSAGDIGTGIDATGPLGPTELGRAVAFEIRDVEDDVVGAEDDGPEPPPNTPPTVEVTATVVATITADPVGFNPPGNAPTPPTGEGGPVDEDDVNGLPPGFVTLDTDRVIEIVFRGETAGLVNSLGGFRVGPDGRIGEAAILFPQVNDQSDPPGFPGAPGPLTPGDSVSLGLVPAGTTLGFFMVQNGGKLPGVDLSTGRIEIRDPVTGEPADLDTLTGPPAVVHIAPSGLETVLPVVFVANDPDPSTPGSNPLNPFGLAYVLSGFDNVSGEVVAKFEDLAGPLGARVPVPGTLDPATGKPWVGTADRDFNDVEFSARFSEASFGDVLFLGDQKGLIQAALDDADGDALEAASVRISSGGLAGDGLALDDAADADGDGIVDGTAIRVEQVSPTELAFSGLDDLEAYEKALGAVVFRSTSGDIQPGTRQITVTVTDERGAVSDPAVVALEIRDDGVVLGDDGDTFLGTDLADAVFGGLGDDAIFGLGGNDLLIGGGGSDSLSGGDGDDVLIGLGGRDLLVGGRGADRFVHTALSDGRDDVQDFSTAEGDRLDLEKFFRGTAFDPDGADADQFLRFVVGDLDGSGGANDVAVEADRDGIGTAYGFSAVFHLLNQVDPSLITIDSATTFGERATV
jgi:phosphohistidine swiveling domain-containing protein